MGSRQVDGRTVRSGGKLCGSVRCTIIRQYGGLKKPVDIRDDRCGHERGRQMGGCRKTEGPWTVVTSVVDSKEFENIAVYGGMVDNRAVDSVVINSGAVGRWI